MVDGHLICRGYGRL